MRSRAQLIVQVIAKGNNSYISTYPIKCFESKLVYIININVHRQVKPTMYRVWIIMNKKLIYHVCSNKLPTKAPLNVTNIYLVGTINQQKHQ